MLAQERRRLILQQLHQAGQVLVSDLAETLQVSDETIRRDINVLQSEGALRRVHGGAVLPKENLQEGAYPIRALTNPEAKRQIGNLAASLVNDHDVILIGHGSTTDMMVPALTGRDLTVLTTSIIALNLLMDAQTRKQFTGSVLFLGGTVDTQNRSVHGPLTNQMLSTLSVDKAFIGATAVDEDGIHMYNQEENALSILMLQRCSEAYILAERAKLEKRALYKTCELDEVQHLITEKADDLSFAFSNALQNAGVHLHIASKENSHEN